MSPTSPQLEVVAAESPGAGVEPEAVAIFQLSHSPFAAASVLVGDKKNNESEKATTQQGTCKQT